MSNSLSQFSTKLHNLLESLEESDEVKTTDESSAVVTLADGSTHRLDKSDCKKIFQSEATVKQFCSILPNVGEASVDLYEVTIPDDCLYLLEETLALVNEV